MDRGAWRATVHGVAKSRTQLSDFTSLRVAYQFIWIRITLLLAAVYLPCRGSLNSSASESSIWDAVHCSSRKDPVPYHSLSSPSVLVTVGKESVWTTFSCIPRILNFY